MPRKSRSTGVGRGNGPGSSKTQFKDGMPSRNPHGRPIKPKPTPPASFQDALARELNGKVKVWIGDKEMEILRIEAMALMLMHDLDKASTTPAMRLRIIKECLAIVPAAASPEEHRPSEEAIQAVVKRLADEHRANEEKGGFGGPLH